jgi:hypothetical protein
MKMHILRMSEILPEGCRFRHLTRYRDTPDLHLSQCQGDIFAGWKRPADILASQQPNGAEPVMSVTGMTDLVQDVLTDCSVVASLCATTSRSERGLGKVRSYSLPLDPDLI